MEVRRNNEPSLQGPLLYCIAGIIKGQTPIQRLRSIYSLPILESELPVAFRTLEHVMYRSFWCLFPAHSLCQSTSSSSSFNWPIFFGSPQKMRGRRESTKRPTDKDPGPHRPTKALHILPPYLPAAVTFAAIPSSTAFPSTFCLPNCQPPEDITPI